MALTFAALRATDAGSVAAHLLQLSPQDRSLRFAAGVVVDESIHRYVAGIRFGSDAVFGVKTADGALVGVAHGCLYVAGGEVHLEVAFSVDAAWRRLGLGACLMNALESFAVCSGAHRLAGMCVARNLPMRRLFERAGMRLSREGDELHAFRDLAPAQEANESYLLAA
jgi:GNAT superfamily N-acetyltransferase